MTPEQREELKTAAQRAEPSGCHIYTNPRDSNGWEENSKFQEIATPAAILSLIAQVEALTVPQWIETKIQRPLENQQVFVCIVHKYTNAPTAYNVSIAYYYNGEFRESGHCLQTPSHWKPFQYPAAPTIPAIPGTKEGA